MWRHLIISAVSCIIFAAANPVEIAAGTIVGRIADETGAIISGTAVSLEPGNRHTLTDSIGRFIFDDLTAGTYTLSFDRVGFKHRAVIQVVVNDDTIVVGDVVLQQAAVELPAMVITATRSLKSIESIPQQTNAVSSHQIADRAGKSSADALREEAGIFVQKSNQGGGNAIIRGYSASKVLLMVDGVRLNNSTYRAGNHQYLTTVAPEIIEQIEVVHGPTSTQYGSDAFGGTIHLRSMTPSFVPDSIRIGGRLLSQLSTADNDLSSSLQASISGGKVAVTARGGYKDIGDIDQGTHFGDGLSVLQDGRRSQPRNGFIIRDFDCKAIMALGLRTHLTAAIQQSRMPRVPRYDKYAYEGFLLWDYVDQNRDLSYLTVDREHGDGAVRSSRMTLSLQKQTEGRETRGSVADPLHVEHDKTTTSGISTETHFAAAGHGMLLGMEYYGDVVRSSRIERDPNSGGSITFNRGRYPDKSRFSSIGAFVQDEWQAGERLTVTAGMRLSYLHARMPFPGDTSLPTNLGTVRQSYTAVTTSAGFLLKVTQSLSITSNLGQAFHAPNLNDLSRLGESKGHTFEVPNPNLRPERMNSADVGFKLSSVQWRASGSLFYNWVDNLIESADAMYHGSPTITKGSVTYDVKAKANIGTARIYGFEGSLMRIVSSSLSLRAGLSYTRGINITADEPVGGIPPLFGLIGLHYKRGIVSAEIWSRFASSQRRLSSDDRDDPRIPLHGTPEWYALNCRGAVRAADWLRLRLTIENLFDRLYREHGSGVNAPGRNLISSLELTF